MGDERISMSLSSAAQASTQHSTGIETGGRIRDGRYEELSLSAGAEVASESVPGLIFRVKPSEAWRPGRKIDVLFRGELRAPLTEERTRAEQEKARAEQEKARAEQEKAKAQRLIDRLRAAGLDPEDEPS